MKKTIISLCTISAMLFTSGVQADVSTPQIEQESVVSSAPQPTDPVATDAVATSYGEVPVEQEKEVGKASTEGATAAKSKRWQNITLAVAAVAVAVTALVLVSNNNGHHK